jgi:hypothetical protein
MLSHRLSALAAVLAVCSPLHYPQVQIQAGDGPALGAMIRNIRGSRSRANLGRGGGARKKQRAKRFARARGRRMSRR